MSSANLIKREALKLFSVHGYEGTSMEAISSEVGIRKASLYSHFKGKEHLFLTIVDELIQKNREILQELADSIKGASTREQLYAIFRHLSCYPLEADREVEFDFFRRMLFFPPLALKPVLLGKLAVYEQELRGLLTAIFTEGIANGTLVKHDISDLLVSFICNSDGVMMQFQYCTQEEFLHIAQSAWQVFWAGIMERGED